MTASRARSGWRAKLLAGAAGLLLGVVCAGAPDALAQSEPIRLFQLPQIQSPDAGKPDVPGVGAGEWLGSEMVPENIGLWTAETGGLGYDLWRGSRRENVARLLQRVDGIDSPTLRTLALRVLLSEAEASGDPLRPVSPGGTQENLLILRGETLLRLGEPAYLGALMAELQGDAAGAPSVLKLVTQASLLVGDYARACEAARDGVVRAPADDFWTKAQVACQLGAGQADEALLGLDLVRESGEGEDTGFLTLADAALGYGKPPAEAAPTPLDLALVLGSKLAPPEVWQDSRDPAVVAMAARDGDLPSDRRLELAERAASAGAVGADELTGFYERAADGSPADALAKAAGLAGAEARALLFVAARAEPAGPARADLAAQALQRARADGMELGVVRVFAPLVAEIQPNAVLTNVAPAAARALLLSGNYDQAAAWIDELRRSAGVNPAARQALVDVWPLAKLAGVEVPGGPRGLADWRDARRDGGAADEALASQVVALRSLLYALGESDSLSFGELIGSEAAGSMTGTSTLLALEQAAAGGRLGETVLLAVTVVGENGIGGHPYAMAKAVEALNRVGRPGEARALAMEAAVSRGL